ncbi:MAG: RNA polymerase sigma factor [Candidatus Hydrogenedentes bacterium]|nr:RNA polymerase sigma factor [Candidatus Hydrogenedentota bacterium]
MSQELVSNYSEALANPTADSPSDLDLVTRTKRGDTEAFSELVRRHQQVVYGLAYRFMRDASLAEDMAQEAFLKAFRLLHGFRGDCSFSTWMYRVTCSVCLTELSRRKKRGEVELMPSHVGAAANLTSPESSDTAHAVRACVSKLPERYASIISSYYLHDISYDEIARLMRIPMGTLKTWMFRARKQLRKIVEQELASDETD